MNGQKWFVTGIGTDVGKSVLAAIFVEAFKADYWKPIQAGWEGGTDSEFIDKITTGSGVIHDENYRLRTPMSPHAAASREGIEIAMENIHLPKTTNDLVVEGAGGLFVPLNDHDTILDLIASLHLPVILVSRHYLGSINHTLLSIEALRNRKIPIELLVFIGDHPETESIILKMSGIKRFFKIPEAETVDFRFIQEQAERLRAYLISEI